MKKIVVIFNGINAPWHITTFALNIARQNEAEVHALFLRDERAGYPYPSDIDSVESAVGGKIEREGDEEIQGKNIELFKAFCDDEKVKCFFQKNVTLQGLVDFSSDADCIVADSHDDFQRYSLKDILSQVKCPVCLISVNATKIKNVVLLYDGGDDALHAIKTYSNLFPKLARKKSYLVTINAKEKIKKKERQRVLEKLEKKFSDLEIVSLSGNLEKKLIEFLDEHTENTFVVMGAYGRSAISRLFKPSLSNVILEQTRTSLFIAHD